ncbi:MAG: OsmC family protein [Myxococcales bacterium]|nr:OsmC family protein [Myxococcales bacterium]
MDLRISFPGGKRVDASFDGHVVHTDQPVAAGGEDSAPAPFDLFLASLGTCAGIYVVGFCQARGISLEGVEMVQRVTYDPETKLPSQIAIDIDLPPSFPEKYREAVRRVAEKCKVKAVIAAPPEITVHVSQPSQGNEVAGDVSRRPL